MGKKQFQARAEVVLTGLAVSRNCKPVLRAPAVTNVLNRAPSALRSKRITLVIPELALLGRRHEFQQVGLMNVPQQVTRLDEVIAGIKIAVELQRRAVAASRGVDAQ